MRDCVAGAFPKSNVEPARVSAFVSLCLGVFVPWWFSNLNALRSCFARFSTANQTVSIADEHTIPDQSMNVRYQNERDFTRTPGAQADG
jgi:hypothetical protein